MAARRLVGLARLLPEALAPKMVDGRFREVRAGAVVGLNRWAVLK